MELGLNTVPEAAKRLRVSTRTIWTEIYEQKIHITRIRGRVFITDQQLIEYVSNQKQKPVKMSNLAKKAMQAQTKTQTKLKKRP
jgi:DNA polymerase I-like protein with 3'-5' exonuclease and polymerase domains